MSTEAANWALCRAPLPKADTAAQLVLARLAWRADKHGRNADLPPLALAHDLNGVDPETVSRVLKRLVQYGLISKDGVGEEGQPIWRLHLNVVRASNSFDLFAANYRRRSAAKRSRNRSNKSAIVPDDASGTGLPVPDVRPGTVPDDGSGTSPRVPDDGGGTSPTMDRSVPDDASDGLIKPPTGRNVETHTASAPVPGAGEATTPTDLFGEPRSTDPSPTGQYSAEFEQFWMQYRSGANGGNPGAKGEAWKEWKRAMRKTNAAAIMAALPRYLASTDPQRGFIKHARTWLHNDGWAEDWPPHRGHLRAVGEHQPYRDPDGDGGFDGVIR